MKRRALIAGVLLLSAGSGKSAFQVPVVRPVTVAADCACEYEKEPMVVRSEILIW